MDFALTDKIPLWTADRLIASLREPERVIDEAALAIYARRVVEIGVDALVADRQLLIFPLRGGVKPGLQLEVLTEYRPATLWLPFTAGSQGGYDPAVTRLIADAIESLIQSGRELKLAVVDTAISGHGAAHLAEILARLLLKYAPRTSDVVFYLLHGAIRYPDESNVIEGFNSAHSRFRRRLYPVDSLLVEDWAEAIGLEVMIDDGAPLIIKPATTQGTLIVRGPEGVKVYRSDELHHFVDLLIANSIDEEIRTYPNATHLRDVWKRYIRR